MRSEKILNIYSKYLYTDYFAIYIQPHLDQFVVTDILQWHQMSIYFDQ